MLVIPDIQNELSGIHIAGYTLVRQSTYISKKIYKYKQKPRYWAGLDAIYSININYCNVSSITLHPDFSGSSDSHTNVIEAELSSIVTEPQ